MNVNCNKYETKEIIKFMRDCTELTQKDFAALLDKKRGWCAKLESGITNITLKDFLELARKNNITINMEKK